MTKKPHRRPKTRSIMPFPAYDAMRHTDGETTPLYHFGIEPLPGHELGKRI